MEEENQEYEQEQYEQDYEWAEINAQMAEEIIWG